MNLRLTCFNAITVSLSVLLTACVATTEPDPKKSEPAGAYSTKQAVGASAKDFLSDSSFSRLLVEVHAMPGYLPTQAAITNLKAFLQERLNKTEISVSVKQIGSGGKSRYSFSDVRAIEDQNRQHSPSREQGLMTAYFLILDGDAQENVGSSVILGVAHRNTSMALYGKSIHDRAGGFGQPSTSLVESTVMNHEFAHILGLVDVGTEMQSNHKDEAHGSHCNNSNCLMHWAVDTGDVISNLLGSGSVPKLDANCIQDLQAAGGK